MRNIAEIKNEIEVLRNKLNERMEESESRVPNEKVMELSKKMDELLNELADVSV